MKVIVIGGGKLVYFITRQFISKGYQVAIINRDPEESRLLARQLNATVVLGDGSDPKSLDEAEARVASVVLSLTPHDQDNLVACQVASRIFGVPRTVALVNDPENEDVFRRLGVTVAFSATKIIASLIEEQTGFEDMTNLLPLAGGRVRLIELILHDDAPAVGKTLRDLGLPDGTLIASVLRRGSTIVPSGTTVLAPGDEIVVVSQPEDLGRALRQLTGEEA